MVFLKHELPPIGHEIGDYEVNYQKEFMKICESFMDIRVEKNLPPQLDFLIAAKLELHL
jgi:hypothetical protein